MDVALPLTLLCLSLMGILTEISLTGTVQNQLGYLLTWKKI
jgi:hypothetical protein